ncbi:MAG: sialidase family protein [Candidatus Dormibacteria bacterium]
MFAEEGVHVLRSRRVVLTGGAAAVMALGGPMLAGATGDTSVLVSNGSPTTPFSQNKQNEPALGVDAHNNSILVAGANEEIDEQACSSQFPSNPCPFTPGVGVSGVYFSFDSGHTWNQPTYSGYSARACAPNFTVPVSQCAQSEGPIGTLPWYEENGLTSDGDPGIAFGPAPGTHGFSWGNGERLYYSNLTSGFPTNNSLKGFEGIAVSRMDNPSPANYNDKAAWQAPVLISKQSNTTFSDKSQAWADNASSSPYFGNVYVCWAMYQGQEKSSSGASPAALQVAVSGDGGNTWTQHQVSPAANNGQRNPADACTIRTDSQGNAYLFGVGTVQSAGHDAFELMSVSHNGGTNWSQLSPVVGPVHQPGIFDPVQGRPTIDGDAGARSDLAPAPSIDIANGAPTGNGASNRIVLSYVSSPADAQPNNATVYYSESSNQGGSWSSPRAISAPGDHGLFAAPASSLKGHDVYVVYNALTTPYQSTTTSGPRWLVGVVLHAAVSGSTGPFSAVNRGSPGDARGSSANSQTSEFLGDYVYAVATNTYGAAVWNDTRNAQDCAADDTYRQNLEDGVTPNPKPDPPTDCPTAPNFGNSDIYGYSSA